MDIDKALRWLATTVALIPAGVEALEITRPERPGSLPFTVEWEDRSFRTLYSVHFLDKNTGWAVGHIGTILTTKDGGDTWILQTSRTRAHLYSVCFVDETTGWAAGQHTLIVTTDGGETWSEQTSAPVLDAVQFFDTDTGWAVGAGGTILATTDGGDTWNEKTCGTTRALTSVHFVDERVGWGVGVVGTIVATTDGGDSWKIQTSGTNETLHSVYFIDEHVGWAVGDKGTILATTDGGENWRNQHSGIKGQLRSVYFVTEDTGWAVGKSGTILATTNGGDDWRIQTYGRAGMLYSVHFLDEKTGWAIGDAGTILSTTNSGKNWIQQGGTSRSLGSVHFSDANTGWAVGGAGVILATTDGGVQWKQQNSGTGNRLGSVYFCDANTGWAVGSFGTILATTNGGDTWKERTSETRESLSSVYFIDEKTGWTVGQDGTILSTTDGGNTWINMHAGTTRWLRSVHFFDADTGWAVGGGGTILSTTDGGITWNDQTSGTTEQLRSVYFQDENTGWAVGDAGIILITNDGGKTWGYQVSRSSEGLYAVHFLNVDTGWAVGGKGILLSTTDGGYTWNQQNSATTEWLYSVHFIDKNTGWAVGNNGTMVNAQHRNDAPYVSWFQSFSTPSGISMKWTPQDEQPASVDCIKLQFCQGDHQACLRRSEMWQDIEQESPLTATDGAFAYLWNPDDPRYRIEKGERFHFLATLTDKHGLQFTSGPFEGPVWQPWWERLLWYHWTLLGVAAYFGICGLILCGKPLLFLYIYPSVPLEGLAEATPEPFSRLALRALLAVVGLKFFATRTQTRRAWAARLRDGRAKLDGLESSIRKSYLEHDEVLDAWVEKHAAAAERGFRGNRTFQEREVYVPVPVTLEDKGLPNLTAEDLRKICAEHWWCLLVQGEGGAGKTSLACQIALWGMSEHESKRLCPSHRMLPVLIEPGANLGEGNTGFVGTLQGRLRTTIGSTEPIEDDLADRLLRRKRILVIVDGLSELHDTTAFDPSHNAFPVAALVVTSRREERLGDVPKQIIRPVRVDGQRLSSFMDTYLTHKGIRDEFTDRQFFAACGRLSDMVGDKSVTPLLAKLYAEQLVSVRNPDDLPRSIPDLMLRYLDELNRGRNPGEPDDLVVHQAAMTAAWHCLKGTFIPALADRKNVVTDLGEPEQAEHLLAYLEERLRVIEIIRPARRKIRFSLDPLAEYLAALRVIELNGKDEEKWKDFITQADGKPGSPEAIRGFLLAVRECCAAELQNERVPDHVQEELARRAGLEESVVERARRLRRIEFLMRNVTAREASVEDRVAAVKALGNIRAEEAADLLTEKLEDETENGRVRFAAARALGAIGPVMLPRLINNLQQDDEGIRLVTIEAIQFMRSDARAAIPALIRQMEDKRVRGAIPLALSYIGPAPIPEELVQASKHSDEDLRYHVTKALNYMRPYSFAVLKAMASEDPSVRIRNEAAHLLQGLAGECQE